MLPIEEIRLRLKDRTIEWHPTIDSTMHRAAELARGGCASGTIVVADQQTAGMGRHGRKWHSEAGQGLYVSFVLRLHLPPTQLSLVMLALGLAARQAIIETTSLAPDLRWPNDVLIREKKCCGVLANLEGDAVIVGIGINVSQPAFPDDLETPATSLALEGANVTREELLIALAHSLDHHGGILLQTGSAPILDLFTAASSFAVGRRVRIETPDRAIVGTTAGLDASGFLRVREDSGAETTILAGGVRPI